LKIRRSGATRRIEMTFNDEKETVQGVKSMQVRINELEEEHTQNMDNKGDIIRGIDMLIKNHIDVYRNRKDYESQVTIEDFLDSWNVLKNARDW